MNEECGGHTGCFVEWVATVVDSTSHNDPDVSNQKAKGNVDTVSSRTTQKHEFPHEHNSGVKNHSDLNIQEVKKDVSVMKLTPGFIIPDYEVVTHLCHKCFIPLISSKIKRIIAF